MVTAVCSLCRDPRWNLAMEEWLLNRGETLLYLWRNDPTVVVGRNQDPFAECVPSILQRDGVFLVRRKSGGGAVYHDPGNLNITMVSAKSPDALQRNFRFMIDCLQKFGITVQLSGRNDLEVEGKKVSGSAYYETEKRFCHHCTMLVNADLEAASRYLTPSVLKLQSRGIASVRSRMANLSEFIPGLTPEKVAQMLLTEAKCSVSYVNQAEMGNISGVRKLARQYESPQWTYGESPAGDMILEEKYPWGLFKISLGLDSGKVCSCKIDTDSLQTAGFETLSAALIGCDFLSLKFWQAAKAFPDPEIRKDLLTLLEKF